MMYRKKYDIFWCSLNWRLRGNHYKIFYPASARRYQGGEEKAMVSRSVENKRVEVENDVPDD